MLSALPLATRWVLTCLITLGGLSTFAQPTGTTCPDDITIVAAADSCGATTLAYDFTNGTSGTTTECAVNITVTDETAPTLVCLTDTTVALNAMGTAGVTAAELAGGMEVEDIDVLANMDDMFAPGFFSDQNRPAGDYFPSDVTVTTTWEVLNRAVAGFPQTGLSDPNKLAWNTSEGTTGNTVSFSFAAPISQVSFLIAASDAAGDPAPTTVTATAFDAQGGQLEQITESTSITAITVAFSATNISRIEVLTERTNSLVHAGCLDNLRYTRPSSGELVATDTATTTSPVTLTRAVH